MPRLTLFDLDHTLLDGDSDVLWCDFLMQRGVLERADFQARNERMARDYQAGTVSAQAFCEFYVATLAARPRAAWLPLRQAFLDEVVAPRLPAAAHTLVRQHQDAGDLVVMTTATNRFITELTASHLGMAHLIATECECDAAGEFTGRTLGTVNMREGKVVRLQAWLGERRAQLSDFESTLYTDSSNDLPLLEVVDKAVAVNPDPRLAEVARDRGWTVLDLHRRAPA